MRDLVVHINDPARDEAAYLLEMLSKRTIMKRRGWSRKNLEHQFLVQKELTEKINATAETDPGLLDEFTSKAKLYFQELHRAGLRNWLIDPALNHDIKWTTFLSRVFLLILGLPVYLVGVIGNIAGLYIADAASRAISKHREFYSSFAIGTGLVAFQLIYIGWFFLLRWATSNIWLAFAGCAVIFLCGMFSVFYHPFMLKSEGMLRILKSPETRARFERRRQELMELVNKFCTAERASTAR
jgi:hypothetical protein